MKKNNITELVCILDRSGSMSGLESDTIGGFNALIEKQKKEDGVCRAVRAAAFLLCRCGRYRCVSFRCCCDREYRQALQCP